MGGHGTSEEARLSRAVLLFVLGYLLVQILVPVLQLAKPHPVQFGWQMYADVRSAPRLEVFTPETSYSVPWDSVLVNGRSDVRSDERLVAWLCRQPDAERVRIHREVPSQDRTLACGR